MFRENPVPVPQSEPAGGRLLRLAAICPGCGAPPALRVTEPVARSLAGRPAAERVGTYQCQRRRCGAIYDLTAGAYQRAR